MSLLLWECKQYLLVAPVEPEDKTKIDDDKYKGATVIEPIPGFYIDPVTTLDFSSLYPSIMISHNLCYSSILDGTVKVPEDLIYTIPTDQGVMRFVKQGVKLGVFVMVLEGLLAARNAAKAGAAANKEGDKLTPKGKMYDIRQNALKMTANSGYGMAGATNGLLPCRGISASVTKIGRDGIDLTAQVVTRPYAPIPISPVEFEFQYHERVKTQGWPFDEKKTPSDVLKAVRMDYFKNRRPESKEQFEKRRTESLASYPIPRLPNETIEEHAQRILEAIDFIYGDTDSIMVLQKQCKNAEEAICHGTGILKVDYKVVLSPADGGTNL
jgi:DNA polymerase elongation subunit (family B)